MENLGLFEKYLDGSLSESEMADFRNRLASDQELEDEFKIYLEVNDFIVHHKDIDNFKTVVSEVSNDYFDSINAKPSVIERTKEQRKLILFYKLAASVAILISLGLASYFMYNSGRSNKELYADYYQPYKIDFISRSVNDPLSETSKAFVCFQKGKYDDCIKILSTTKIPDSLSTPFNIIKGLSFMETGRFKEAEFCLNYAATDRSNIMYTDCLWYLSLTYIQLNESGKALPMLKTLVKEKSIYSEKASELISKLE